MHLNDRKSRLEEIAHKLSELTHEAVEHPEDTGEITGEARAHVKEAMLHEARVRNFENLCQVLDLKAQARRTPADTSEIEEELDEIQGEIMESIPAPGREGEEDDRPPLTVAQVREFDERLGLELTEEEIHALAETDDDEPETA